MGSCRSLDQPGALHIMRIGVLGDIHSNLEALQAVLAHAKSQGVERFVCLGDVVGYNANPHECVQLIRSLNCLATVQGNHDYYASNCGGIFRFNPIAERAVKWTREHLTSEDQQWLRALPLTEEVLLSEPPAHFSLVHGSLNQPQLWGYVFDFESARAALACQQLQLCFQAHTHIPVTIVQDAFEIQLDRDEVVTLQDGCKYLVNVGSIGQPRDGDPRASYVVYDIEEGTIAFHRVGYDVAAAQRKILAADGLPERCAERLGDGN